MASGTDLAAYRRQLVNLVYRNLGERQQGTLLVMDNAAEADLLLDYLQDMPKNMQLVITTRNATLFPLDRFPRLTLDAFS